MSSELAKKLERKAVREALKRVKNIISVYDSEYTIYSHQKSPALAKHLVRCIESVLLHEYQDPKETTND